MKCFICDQKLWKNEFLEKDNELSPLHTFYQKILNFAPSCPKCSHKVLFINQIVIGLIGYSGAGKSTLLNILAGKEVNVYLDPQGNLSLSILDSVVGSEVSDSQTSMTRIPNYYSDDNLDFILCDFPGFGDNRGGQLQLLQYLLMQNIVASRSHKFILVKSALTKRDQGFVDLANQEFIRHRNTIAVVSHATVKAPNTISSYTDGQTREPILVVPLLAPYFDSRTFDIIDHNYSDWANLLLQKVHNLESYCGDIKMPQTSEMFRYIALWKQRLLVEIQDIIDELLRDTLATMTIEPYNVDFFSKLFDLEVPLGGALNLLQDARIIEKTSDALQSNFESWSLFEKLGQKADVGSINKVWSRDSVDEIRHFRNRVEEVRRGVCWPESSFEDSLDIWSRKLHGHWLRLASAKSKVYQIMDGGIEERDVTEIYRLASYFAAEADQMAKECQNAYKSAVFVLSNKDLFPGKTIGFKKTALGLSDHFLLEERQIWTVLANTSINFSLTVAFMDEISVTFEKLEAIVLIHCNSLNGLDLTVHSREDLTKLLTEISSRNKNLQSEIIARVQAPVGCHYHEHDLKGVSTFTTQREFDCCKLTAVANFKALYCGFCQKYFHDTCFPHQRRIPCVTTNSLAQAPFPVAFTFNTSVPEQTSFDSFQYCINLLQGTYSENTKYKISARDRVYYVAIKGSEYEPNEFKVFFTDPIRIKPHSQEVCDVVGSFNASADVLLEKIQPIIGTNSVVFTGFGTGGSLAHALHLKMFLKGSKEVASVAIGSPCVFGAETLKYLTTIGRLNSFVTIVSEDDYIPGVMQLLAKGLCSNGQSAHYNDPTIHYLSTASSFASKFLAAQIKVVGRFVFQSEKNTWETNEVCMIEEELSRRLYPEVVKENTMLAQEYFGSNSRMLEH